MEQCDYYPFGMSMEGSWNQSNTAEPENNYLYNGKELDQDFGLDWYHYVARMYDAQIGRFTGVDPISDQFAWVSTYNYAENEPIANIDLHGLQKEGFMTKFQQSVDKVKSNLAEQKQTFVNALGLNNSAIMLGPNSQEQANSISEARSIPNQMKENLKGGAMEGLKNAVSVGETLEVAGDMMAISAAVITPVAPALGIPMMAVGTVVSYTGSALQIGGEAGQGNYDKAGQKIIIEAVPLAGTSLLNRAVDRAATSNVGQEALNSEIIKQQISLGAQSVEKATESVIKKRNEP